MYTIPEGRVMHGTDILLLRKSLLFPLGGQQSGIRQCLLLTNTLMLLRVRRSEGLTVSSVSITGVNLLCLLNTPPY